MLAAIALTLTAAAIYVYARMTATPSVDLYRTERVARRTIVEVVEATGHLDARNRVEVPAPIAGRLIRIAATSGQRVEAGTLLALLDPRAAEVSVRSARASVEAAAGKTAQARAALNAAERAERRTRELVDKGLASPDDLEKARADLEQARAEEQAARGEQRLAHESVASAELDKSLTEISAPVPGVVLRAPDHRGAVVGPGSAPLFVIGDDLSSMRVDTFVSETDIVSIKRGQAAEVLVSAFPGRTFSAKVTELGIDPKLEGGAVLYPVTLAVDNPDGALLPGMSARVRMNVARVERALSVHEAALRFEPPEELDVPKAEPRSRVWKRVDARTIEPVIVKALVSDGAFTQIEPVRGALKEGDLVAVGLSRASDGGGPRVRLGEKR